MHTCTSILLRTLITKSIPLARQHHIHARNLNQLVANFVSAEQVEYTGFPLILF